MERERIMLEVYVDLDPVPGTFHSKESARNQIANMLNSMIPHYNPMVSITNYAGTSNVVTENPYAHPDCTCATKDNSIELAHQDECDILTRRYKDPEKARAARELKNLIASGLVKGDDRG